MKTEQTEWTASELLELVVHTCGETTLRAVAADPDTASRSFVALGVDSVNVFQLQFVLEERLGVSLPETFLLDHPTPSRAAMELERLLKERAGKET